jgi:hypothetical protein
MLVLQQELLDVSWHQYIEGACVVVPIYFDCTIEIAGPIFSDFIHLFDASDEVINVVCFMYFTPKSSTTNVNDIWCILCFHRPGMLAHS